MSTEFLESTTADTLSTAVVTLAIEIISYTGNYSESNAEHFFKVHNFRKLFQLQQEIM